MADRVLFISWGNNHAGREARGLEVFNEAVGMSGRMQQEGKIEGFDVVLLAAGGPIDGYIAIRGTAQQLFELRESEEFQRNIIDATLVVKHINVADGATGEELGRQMQMYQEALERAPQMA